MKPEAEKFLKKNSRASSQTISTHTLYFFWRFGFTDSKLKVLEKRIVYLYVWADHQTMRGGKVKGSPKPTRAKEREGDRD